MNTISLSCGLDEAGRGPLAGPVTAGAVILAPDFPVEVLNDSKALSPKKRAAAEKIIKEQALWGLGIVDHETIDRMNILNASMYAMKLAFDMMLLRFDSWCASHNLPADRSLITAIADGNKAPPVSCPCRPEVKADARFPEVMAASIIAKEERDRIMIAYDKDYPEYGYARHKGYPTPAHKKICREIGPSPIQRLSFSY
ncbi:MAG: ribonuclease HII [Treponema sp.]|nr:ribonuclease HII [Treponema sp.]